jgi:hypothetical protein
MPRQIWSLHPNTSANCVFSKTPILYILYLYTIPIYFIYILYLYTLSIYYILYTISILLHFYLIPLHHLQARRAQADGALCAEAKGAENEEGERCHGQAGGHGDRGGGGGRRGGVYVYVLVYMY